MKTHELLYMSAEAYADEYFERYLRWCISRSVDPDFSVWDPKFVKADLQHILANAGISKWYRREFTKLEEQFEKMVSPQHNLISCEAARNIFNSITLEMHKKFPQPLIEAARHLNIICQLKN